LLAEPWSRAEAAESRLKKRFGVLEVVALDVAAHDAAGRHRLPILDAFRTLLLAPQVELRRRFGLLGQLQELGAAV
jgi:hypothetical protein